MVGHGYNPSPLDAKAEDSECEASLGHMVKWFKCSDP